MATARRIELSPRQWEEVWMLRHGLYAPIHTFMGEAAYQAALRDPTLLPVVLDVPCPIWNHLEPGMAVELWIPAIGTIATGVIGERFVRDLAAEAQSLYGTLDKHHVGVRQCLDASPYCVAGVFSWTTHWGPPAPTTLSRDRAVLAFHSRNVLHLGHLAAIRWALEHVPDADLLLSPTLGTTRATDWPPAQRWQATLEAARVLQAEFPRRRIYAQGLWLPMRFAGPREVLWHARIRANLGATHYVVGRSPADPGGNPTSPDGAWWTVQDLDAYLQAHGSRVPITFVRTPAFGYDPQTHQIVSTPGAQVISGTQVRQEGPQSEWLPPPTRRWIPARPKQFVALITGLVGAGKTTFAKAWVQAWQRYDARPIILLDGDVLRHTLFPDLGFDDPDRDAYFCRLRAMVQMLVSTGASVVLALVAPRVALRRQLGEDLPCPFWELWVNTPLAVCQARDAKGIYPTQADALPGVTMPYEVPLSPTWTIDGTASVEDQLRAWLRHLKRQGWIDWVDAWEQDLDWERRLRPA